MSKLTPTDKEIGELILVILKASRLERLSLHQIMCQIEQKSFDIREQKVAKVIDGLIKDGALSLSVKQAKSIDRQFGVTLATK